MGCKFLYRKGLCGLCDTQLQKSVSCIFFVFLTCESLAKSTTRNRVAGINRAIFRSLTLQRLWVLRQGQTQ